MEIRKASFKDIEAILMLSKAALTSSVSENWLQDVIRADETYYVFVLVEKKVVGYLIVWLSLKKGAIIDLVIAEEKRKGGYGKKLLAHGINFFYSNDVEEISLEVKVSNQIALKLYNQFGFEIIKTLPHYYQQEDGFLMVRRMNK